MAHLTDMEELLSSIKDPAIREYMREAMNCYMAAAYRGCIVMSYVALFDDLLIKLGELGKVNKSAKDVFTEASKKKTDQEVFESYLIDQLSSKKLLSGLDSTFLHVLRTIRNKSAHPSGHKPSSEEARFVFFEVVDRFLSKPILSTSQLVDELINRLANENFFPTSLITDIKEVVEDEIENLHPQAMPLLVVKLVSSFCSNDIHVSKNSGYFLTGLARINDSTIQDELKRRLIKGKSDDEKYSEVILRAISSNGNLVVGVGGPTTKRIKRIITKKTKAIKASESETRFSHPASVLVSLASVLDEEVLVESFGEQLEEFFSKRPYSPSVIDAIKDKPVIKEYLIDELIERAGSSTFDTANEFARAVEDIDDVLSKTLTNEEAFKLICAVIRAADWGAFTSKDLVGRKFSSIPNIRGMARAYATKKKTTSRGYLKGFLGMDVKASEFTEKYLGSDA